MSALANPKHRPKIPIDVQVGVFFRDRWICQWCHRPTVFGPSLKYLQMYIENQRYPSPVAYYDLHYRRDKAPLLDHMAAVIDHIEAYSVGGEHNEGNFVTACNKCNMRKSAQRSEDYLGKWRQNPVKGRYGEPEHWDGFASLFVIFGRQFEKQLTKQEKEWLRSIGAYLASDREKA